MFVFSSFGRIVVSAFFFPICFYYLLWFVFHTGALCRSWYKKLLRGFSLCFFCCCWGFWVFVSRKTFLQTGKNTHRVKSINKFLVANWTDMKSFWACYIDGERSANVWQAEMEMSVWSPRTTQLLKVYGKDMPCSLFSISISMWTQLNILNSIARNYVTLDEKVSHCATVSLYQQLILHSKRHLQQTENPQYFLGINNSFWYRRHLKQEKKKTTIALLQSWYPKFTKRLV